MKWFYAIRQWFNKVVCRHAFILDEIGRRDGDTVEWSCAKCGKQFVFQYGLQALDHGEIYQREKWNRRAKEEG